MTATTGTANLIPFNNSYARLPDRFYAKLAPTPVAAPRMIRLNSPLARQLGIDPEWLSSPAGVAVLAGNKVPIGAEPLAMAYAGHQFGGFSPQLGDGRAILLGEVIDRDGVRRDIQLKGSGPTPFSRRGDGRAALGPVLREYIVSEAMAALGIPTTRALAAVTTGESIRRETLLPGAVFVRIASSHIRVGTFQFFAARDDREAVQTLADYVISRHYPEAAEASNRYRTLLDLIVRRQAELVARWMLIGFIHGVMNTDNTSVAGETIDYGPCAFMDTYDPAKVYSSIDRGGRYAFGNQVQITMWNLARLAETLVPLLGDNDEAGLAQANEVIAAFPAEFQDAYVTGLRQKLGLQTVHEDDLELAQDLLDRMAAGNADYTLTFRCLSEAAGDPTGDNTLRQLFDDPKICDAWLLRWRQRVPHERTDANARRAAMCRVNPAVIPRNHLVEEAISAAVQTDDFAPFEQLTSVLSKPFEDQPAHSRYTLPPRQEQIVSQTFCGT